jgi:hypothetical protein
MMRTRTLGAAAVASTLARSVAAGGAVHDGRPAPRVVDDAGAAAFTMVIGAVISATVGRALSRLPFPGRRQRRITIPAVLGYYVAQRHLVSGLTTGGMKG